MDTKLAATDTFVTPGDGSIVDSNGAAGNDNFPDYLSTSKDGHFWNNGGWGASTINKVFDTTGKAEFDFRVGMQPGNNYRIVASIKDSSGYASVQTNTPNASYLGPEISQNGGVISTEPLTVWRKLWVENDSMSAIPTYPNNSKRNDITASLIDPKIRETTYLGAAEGTRFLLPVPDDLENAASLEDNYGKILIAGVFYPVTTSGYTLGAEPENGTSGVYVEVEGDRSSSIPGTSFRLYDDDDYGLNAEPLPRTNLLADEIIKNLYKIAFVEIADAADYNPRKLVEFNRNHPVLVGPLSLSYGVWDDAIDLSDSNQLWVANLIAGYQGGASEDKDPSTDGVLSGGTPPDRRYSVVYVETIRDELDAALRNFPNLNATQNAKIKTEIAMTSAHEIGHMPGGGTAASHHDEGGLMGPSGSVSGPKFSAESVARFRQTLKWQQQ